MPLINILEEYLKLTDEEKYYTIENECPCDYEIFKIYAQGQKEWECANVYSNCYDCWYGEPIEL